MRKGIPICLLLFAALLLGGWLKLLLIPGHRIDWQSIRQINMDMPAREVYEILGPPTKTQDLKTRPPLHFWIGDNCEIQVQFEDGKVVFCCVQAGSPKTMIGKIRSWLRL